MGRLHLSIRNINANPDFRLRCRKYMPPPHLAGTSASPDSLTRRTLVGLKRDERPSLAAHGETRGCRTPLPVTGGLGGRWVDRMGGGGIGLHIHAHTTRMTSCPHLSLVSGRLWSPACLSSGRSGMEDRIGRYGRDSPRTESRRPETLTLSVDFPLFPTETPPPFLGHILEPNVVRRQRRRRCALPGASGW